MKLDARTVDRALAVVVLIVWVIVAVELARGRIPLSLAPLFVIGAIAYAVGLIIWIRRSSRPNPTTHVLSLKLAQLAMLGAVVAAYIFRTAAQFMGN